ncbi:Fatty acid synthase [Eumeta japonica]|uniref:Fatty acid synthase n=1 Tax=Eumeta variegata TaxID=151549 RepID=A0A4C1SZI8_EUMVA|nr:Fatty acid synthase [Eumeta japonica]
MDVSQQLPLFRFVHCIPGRYSSLPYLVSISGRLETSVQHVIEELRSLPLDPESIALLHSIHEKPTVGHMGRGYVILSPASEEGSPPKVLAEAYQYYPDLRRPLCFVYSGMGSQWATMGAELLRLPIFAAAIERCRQVLEPRGVDLMRILTDPEPSIFDNILHSFVGIAAVQIGLTDVLRELGLKPDYIIVSENNCAYADECFTLEETILAYSRGLVSVETPFVRGAMAAVRDLCPPDVAIACHSSDSCTISGPAESLRAFVSDLRARGIFAKEVPCSNIAYHSQYIAAAGPALLQHLSAIITEPKRRSERWLSTSVPQDNWSKPAAIFSSAEYHTNNLLRPVLFEETARLLPRDAMLVEIAPHGLLQAILRRSMPSTCINIPLTRRAHSEPITFLLEAIGKIYIGGHQPRLAVLYPAVEFPVSTGTPLLSHLMEWMHDEAFSQIHAIRIWSYERKFIISLHDEDYQYLVDRRIYGVPCFSAAGLLLLVWETYAMAHAKRRDEFAVEFHRVKLAGDEPQVHEDRPLRLYVAIQRGCGYFEIVISFWIVFPVLLSTPICLSLDSNHGPAFDSEPVLV